MSKFKTPLEAFLYWEKHTPDIIFLKQPIDGKYITHTYKEAGIEIRKIVSALKTYNLSERSHVALLSKNCAHWIMADIAIMMAGFVSIPIYPTLNASSINQILVHSESKAIIIGKLDDYESQKSGVPDIPKISVGLHGQSDGELWEELIKKHSPSESIHTQQPDDLHTIIYTSGTTGVPKGVMHTSGNLMVSAHTLTEIFKLPNNIKLFSYLPLAHVAERVLINAGVNLGGTVAFAESLETFASDLEKTQPQIFFAVPRIWTKFREKILESIPQKKLNVLLKIPILNGIIKNKLKQKLGLKEAVFICSAAAPIASSLVKWYRKLGITIYQGYGMTEDCCVSHFNTIRDDKIGTVGKTLFNVKAKLSEVGEICVKNDCLMKGYYKEPEITASVFDDEGYLKTGDIGEFDHDGFLTITGRVKDQFKTDKGKYISPSHIELILSKNTDIEQICVVGTGIPQPIALITLSELGKVKDKNALSESLLESVDGMNPTLEKHEKIEKVVIMKEDWNVENGLTTPTMKVKRNSIEKIHEEFYKEWFELDDKVIFE
ncbi:AMP-binding protein [Flavobacteriaceae bacterium S0825]|uniref:AMP-binding protein n=1 Tax=Gaetbulibacter sp. S0825 TaxID=2720084 RepID=UPI0014319906|nr:AMP-binding protein [Gaetbulibacter sp. S0825]MCK0109360.1 AMP-binding protein [Flavobacteriaceae bacterium S0825]NIX64994.1 AMP-binding protein [Gaetbulibacter sp. S0825]